MAGGLLLLLVLLGLCVNGGWGVETGRAEAPWRVHTLFSVECQNYFDWQTVGLMNSYRKARQPGPITRLLSCTDDEKKKYKGMHLAPTFEVPSMSRHPKTGDWSVLHWFSSPFVMHFNYWLLKCSSINEFALILVWVFL